MTEIDAIMDVMDCAFDPRWGEAWTRKQVSDALAMPHTFAILVDDHGEVWRDGSGSASGFVLSRHAADEEELLLIGVMPSHRRRGIGLALIEALFASSSKRGAKQVFLEMRRDNPAQSLYAKVGFEPIGERRDYYRLSDGSRMDAITFGRAL